ncbi:sugar phosphate nucleotidyltransferase [Sulfurihydrogenibium azorense]|uniref:sugar phosphate nucleotidyltransferase n=1 Tax=Sulfurihydrogenibium azorense TaxID=309806 RepID=UPI002409A5C1|nr:sugar phosphate nucleotidyltransferase [Sulfurihydrogenibium azorense]MDM7273184.1 sugar phosphate nucleotidyltransferase [Sulfurihydrogenibium azorense]
MKAVIMAGGFGTRIQPLTNSIPKPMLPVLNKPMMEHIIKKVKAVGITEIVILLYFKPEVIQNYFKDGSDFGIKINYVLPDDDYGTAGAVKKAAKYLDERFIVISGDLVTDFDLKEIIGFHQAVGSKLTITLTSVEDPLQFGVVITDKDGKILRFLEKPGWGEVFSDTINTGIYVIEPEILNYIPDNLPFDFSKDLFPKLMKEGITLYGYNAKGYWRDVGNPESYREVNKDILLDKVKLDVEGERIKVNGGVLYTKTKDIPKDLTVNGKVVLDENVKIGNNCYLENVVMGKNTHIGDNVYLKDCVIWWDCKIGDNTKLNNAVICNNVEIGKNVRAEHGVIIAEGTEVKDNVHFEKDVIVWPNKLIEEGAIISSNLIWGDKWKASIFEGGKVSGRTNIELSNEMAAKLAASFGSILPAGKTILMSRDYHRASRMLKRSFLGGLLGAGLDVVDLKLMPLPVMRYLLSKSDAVAAVHFRQSPDNPAITEILFFDSEGLAIDTNTEKSVERIFFRENFRRVNYNQIGEIKDDPMAIKSYKEKFLSLIDKEIIQSSRFKIIVDLLNGSTSIVYPDIINTFSIENVILNAYFDEKKISQISTLHEKSAQEISKIVKVLSIDCGFIMYPNGQRVVIVSDEGEILSHETALLSILYLIDRTVSRQVKVYLPVYIPEVMDEMFENIIIERGKFIGLKSNFLKDYYFFANLEGNYAFTDMSFSYDGMFTSVKLLEMMGKTKLRLSQIQKLIPPHTFIHKVVACPSNLKGKMMRKFTEEAIGKEASFIDGVKIFIDKRTWILMIPDQYSDNLHLYVNSDVEEKAQDLLNQYIEKIGKWIEEN